MPSYKLVYFDIYGRAEEMRYMFALAGEPYEDYRIQEDEWGEYKPTTPLGQLPILEVDGVVIPQTGAISRYLAKELGFMGSDNLEAAKIDIVYETMRDVIPCINRKIYRAKTPEEKASGQKDVRENDVATNAALLEKLLIQNNGGDGYFVGDKISMADVSLLCLYGDYFPGVAGGQLNLSGAPKVAALLERLKVVPEIAEWRKKRPQTSV